MLVFISFKGLKLNFGVFVQKKLEYGVGVVTYIVTVPTQYAHFSRKSAPLPHHMATFFRNVYHSLTIWSLLWNWVDFGHSIVR